MAKSEFGLKIVKKFRPVHWEYDKSVFPQDDGRTHFGFIAQELEKLFPIDKYAVVTKDVSTGMLMVNYMELIAPMAKAIQDLSKEVDLLKQELKELKGDF